MPKKILILQSDHSLFEIAIQNLLTTVQIG